MNAVENFKLVVRRTEKYGWRWVGALAIGVDELIDGLAIFSQVTEGKVVRMSNARDGWVLEYTIARIEETFIEMKAAILVKIEDGLRVGRHLNPGAGRFEKLIVSTMRDVEIADGCGRVHFVEFGPEGRVITA